MNKQLGQRLPADAHAPRRPRGGIFNTITVWSNLLAMIIKYRQYLRSQQKHVEHYIILDFGLGHRTLFHFLKFCPCQLTAASILDDG